MGGVHLRLLLFGTFAILLSGWCGQDVDIEGLLQGLDLGSLTGGSGPGGLQIDHQMAERVRALIRHFKQDDPVGVPQGMGLDALIVEPLKVPNLEQTFSGTKMKFQNISLYGINKFRLNHVRVALSDLKIGVGLSIDSLFVNGSYQMAAWFTKAKGPFNVTITNVSTEAEVSFILDSDSGALAVSSVNMDVKFGDIKMSFENLGFFGNIFQGMVNSVGGFLFDSIKPLILADVETKVRGELNRQGRSLPVEFPNSLHPLDSFLSEGRRYIREQGLDPFPIPQEYLSPLGGGGVTFSEGVVSGLASLHRTGPLVLVFEKNVIRVQVSLGAEECKGVIHWSWGWGPFLRRGGVLQLSLEWVTVAVGVSQPANLDQPTRIDYLDVEVGNLGMASDGGGTLDYVLEAGVNILPNLFRKQIVDALEKPVREWVEGEVARRIQIERMIEEQLPKMNGTLI